MTRLQLLALVVGVFALVMTVGFGLSGGGIRAIGPAVVVVIAGATVALGTRRRSGGD